MRTTIELESIAEKLQCEISKGNLAARIRHELMLTLSHNCAGFSGDDPRWRAYMRDVLRMASEGVRE